MKRAINYLTAIVTTLAFAGGLFLQPAFAQLGPLYTSTATGTTLVGGTATGTVTQDPTGMGTTGTTGTTGTIGTPGLPSTGAGGDSATNVALLGLMTVAALFGAGMVMRGLKRG